MELLGLVMSKKIKAERQKPRTESLKKPYIRPHLVEYGNVAKLTASGGSVPPIDAMARMV
jgi:hypothetical protein